MAKSAFVVLVVVLCTNIASDSQAQSLVPPFSSMPSAGFYSFGPLQDSTLEEIVYQGQTSRQMLDLLEGGSCVRDLAQPVEFDAFVFHASYSDGSMVEFLANPEYGSSERAKPDINFWAEMFGSVPIFMRKDARVSVHMANKCGFAYSGDENHFLVYSGTIKTRSTLFFETFDVYSITDIDPNVAVYNEVYDYPGQAQAEEILIHEGAHAAIDHLVKDDPNWQFAQESDGRYISYYARNNSEREDIAESFLAWMILRFGRSYSARFDLTILETIPNRIAYFDDLFSSQEWHGQFSPLGDLELPDPQNWQTERMAQLLNDLANFPRLENQLRLPRESFAKLVATLMDWPKFNKLIGGTFGPEHLDDFLTSENIARALAELHVRMPSVSEFSDLPNFMLQDEVYLSRLESLLELLETPMHELRYTILKLQYREGSKHPGAKFTNTSLQYDNCPVVDGARFGLLAGSLDQWPELLFVSPNTLNQFVQALVSLPQDVVGQELVDLMSEVCIELGWSANMLWTSMNLVDRIIYLEEDRVYKRYSETGEIIGIAKLGEEAYPIPKFSLGKMTVPLLVLGTFDAANDEVENEILELIDNSLFGLWRIDLDYQPVNDTPAFVLGTAKKIGNGAGLQGDFPESNLANKLASSKIDPSTLVLRIPVLETDLGNFLIELELVSFKLFHFEELE